MVWVGDRSVGAEELRPVGLAGVSEQHSLRTDGQAVFAGGIRLKYPLEMLLPSATVQNGVGETVMLETGVGPRPYTRWTVEFYDDDGGRQYALVMEYQLNGRSAVKGSDLRDYYARTFQLDDGNYVIGLLRDDEPAPENPREWLEQVFLASTRFTGKPLA